MGHRVFVIGDWGGILYGKSTVPVPAPQRKDTSDSFVHGVDDFAQQRVAGQMAHRAWTHRPDYVLNVGDNFYWGGIDATCGSPFDFEHKMAQMQFGFENVYTGPIMGTIPWLGVLGNHDYGGFRFDNGWDRLIGYTWGNGNVNKGGRWVLPAQYWRQRVYYPSFSLDYFFLDSNAFAAETPYGDPMHNMCSIKHNPKNATCGEEGPRSVQDCPNWFHSLWATEKLWIDKQLAGSKTDWQIIVTHYPPTWAQEFWKHLVQKHGVDLLVTGHMHNQELHHMDAANFLRPTAWIVSGGGGGITSEDIPSKDGDDDQYGFFELTLSKKVIQIQGISHGGFLRTQTFVHPRSPGEEGSLHHHTNHNHQHHNRSANQAKEPQPRGRNGTLAIFKK